MTTHTNQYKPDYAVPPGWVLKDHLETWGISQAEFARRCGRSPKLISEIISGIAPIAPETALQFEKVLNLAASVWIGIEADYQLHKAQEAEAKKLADYIQWSKRFPIRELVNRGEIGRPLSDVDAVSKLLFFFGVASLDSWEDKYGTANIAYRHSPSFNSDESALATWLRLGEIQAMREECADYNQSNFKHALRQIRQLTRTPIAEALEEAKRLCNNSGVALAIVKPLPKTALSGAAWWLSARKAVIQLSVRHLIDDQLWFSLFHEAAHILFHSKKDVYINVNLNNKKITKLDGEADKWATDFLISRHDWREFTKSFKFSASIIQQFAEEQGIAPGIIVGRLQHEHRIPWKSHLNRLKVRLQWTDNTDKD
ncbi:MAG: ImmA/IrrE family metallo-endopeptidase [Gemmatimonadetes bacterium]|nr:ImmA/IrrE family metallo-endopeptidase [Gemmatimonadota bacterium]